MIFDAMIFEYLDHIERCSAPEQVIEALAKEAMRLGLSAMACWMLTGPKAASRNPFYANTSCPHVSGLVARLASAFPGLAAFEARCLLALLARTPPSDPS